jgi:hypothetical protein
MLWGNIDYASGNLKPVFANTTNLTATSTIHGEAANTAAYYGRVVGVSASEQERSNNTPQHPAHAGWVSMKVGTGPIVGLTISGGTGINSAGYLIITDGAIREGTSGGSGANISYTIANSQNIMQASSANAYWNVINSFSIVSGGSGFSNANAVTIMTNGTAIANATFTAVLGGRAGRINTEVLVAMGSMTGDDPRDNVYFTGV